MDTKQIRYSVAILFFVISIAPTFLPMFDWRQDYSNIGLFIFLYFLVAYIKKTGLSSRVSKKRSGELWTASVLTLVGSWKIIKLIGENIAPSFLGKDMLFYQYCSPIVIVEALGAFLFFTNRGLHNSMVLGTLAKASLVVYLIHMHPMFKGKYVSYGLLNWVNAYNPVLYIAQLIFISLIILIVGVLISIPINSATKRVMDKIVSISFKNN